MFVEVYPKMQLDDDTWTVVVKLRRTDTNATVRVTRSFPAGVPHVGRLAESKIVLIVEVPGGTTLKQVASAFFDRKIRIGMTQRSVWQAWKERAESHIVGLTDDDIETYRKRWTRAETMGLRQAFTDLLGKVRGRVVDIHHHEPDGSVTRG